MSMKPLQELVRPNIWALKPYSSARDEYKGAAASVFLDANENPYNAPYNRYPDPLQLEVKEMLAPVKGVKPGQIFLGNGSDEAIDLAFRIFCEPKTDNVVAIAPTYGMYKVCADINDVAYRPVLLDDGFRLDADKLLAVADEHTKLVFLCSPNNPSGNDLEREEIVKVLERFPGMVVIDEAYADFSCISRIGIRLMHQRLLVSRQNDFDFILFVKLIADINGAGSRITEEILDTLLLQSLYQKFVSCNLFHMKTSCSKFAA